MSIYKYQDPASVLEEIAIRKTAGGGARAFLFAREDITPDQIQKVKKTLEEKHLSCVANMEDGRPCLEIRGSKDQKVLDALLRPLGVVKGTFSIDHSDNEKFSLGETFRNNMVSIYGVMNIVADGFLLAYGKMKEKFAPEKKQWEDKAAAYAYLAGSSMFTLFGRGDKSDYQVRDLALNLRRELEARGVEVSPDSAVMAFSELANGKGPVDKTRHYLAKRGSEAGNIATGTAGAFMMKGALKGKNTTDALLGATTVVSGYGAALVREKAPDPEHPPQNLFEHAKQWVQEKPNRLAGYGYMISTVLHGKEAFTKFKEAEHDFPDKVGYVRKAYTFRGIFTGLNLLGEFVLASASKGHGNGIKSSTSLEDTALAITADAIARQPVEKREELINDLARNFLASANVLGGDVEAMQAKLYQQVHKLEENPWHTTVRKNVASAVVAAPEASPAKWADSKVKKVVAESTKAASHASAVENSRSIPAQIGSP